MLPAEVLLYPREIAQSSGRIMVNTSRLRTHINSLFDFLARSLPQFPRKIMSSAMKLQVLVPLKPFIANFTHESICGQKGFRRQSNHLCIWICKKFIEKENKQETYYQSRNISSFLLFFHYLAFQGGSAFSCP